MLIDRYEPEAVFARVPELAEQTDPVLKRLDRLLEDDQLSAQVRGDRARRSRLRTRRRVLQQIQRVRRLQGADAQERQQALYQRLLEVTRQTLQQAQRVRTALQPLHAAPAQELSKAVRRLTARLAAPFDRCLPLVEQTIRPAQRRVLDGQAVPSREQVLSRFAPHTRVVQRGKTTAAVEFGRQVVCDAVEGGIVTRFQVLADDASEVHQAPAALRGLGHERDDRGGDGCAPGGAAARQCGGTGGRH
jgi:hypothetical protein